MKKILHTLLLILLVLFTKVFAFDSMDIPKIDKYVADYSKVLTPSQSVELNKIAKDYENKTTNQAVVILIPNRK
jgi:uncharacterized membrane protein YgcG